MLMFSSVVSLIFDDPCELNLCSMVMPYGAQIWASIGLGDGLLPVSPFTNMV